MDSLKAQVQSLPGPPVIAHHSWEAQSNDRANPPCGKVDQYEPRLSRAWVGRSLGQIVRQGTLIVSGLRGESGARAAIRKRNLR